MTKYINRKKTIPFQFKQLGVKPISKENNKFRKNSKINIWMTRLNTFITKCRKDRKVYSPPQAWNIFNVL